MPLSSNIKAYWLLLKDLSQEDKLSLIELLLQSFKESISPIKKSTKPNLPPGESDWVDTYYGAWKDTPETAEELIHTIEGTRTTGRPIESL